MKLNLIVLLIFISFSCSFAQSSKEKSTKKKDKAEVDRGATYGVKSTKTKKKKTKYSISKSFDQKVVEYEARMEANAKKYKKRAKEMKKPQYSNPSYFGHKKKPKKRPAGKKKFCKECGMSH
jgi:hypothetical protein